MANGRIMVKRKVGTTDAFAEATTIPVAKKVSPERKPGRKQVVEKKYGFPSPDVLICLDDVPAIVEHPHEEVYLHNAAAIRRGIHQRTKKKLAELSSAEVVARLGLPLKTNVSDPVPQIPAAPVAPAATEHNCFAPAPHIYHGKDHDEFAATSKVFQTHNFLSVLVAIEDLQATMRHMNANGVPAADRLYRYRTANSRTTQVVTTTGERRPVNSILRVRDVMQTVQELQVIVGRFLADNGVGCAS